MEGRRRLTLLEQMSASSNGRALAGLSLDDVLSPAPAVPSPKQPPPAPAKPASISGRTLLDIIRDEEPKSYKALIGKKDKKPWKTFKDRLRLKKASAAWASSILVPTSDVPVRRYNNHHHQGYSHTRARCNSIRYVTPEPQPMAEPGNPNRPPQQAAPSFTRRSSIRFASPMDDVDSPRRRLETAISEDRSLSAREAVAAQQAAEAEAAAAAEAAEAGGEGGDGNAASASASAAEASTSPPEPEPVRMSLMDLLEETDRQMGLEGSRYTVDDEDEEEEEEAAAEAEEEEAGEEGGGVEYSCCVCMVRHKGSAFIPCGHTFCRMCSRELWVQRGNCPLCNNYILEILDIF